jgi:hypothetical protein
VLNTNLRVSTPKILVAIDQRSKIASLGDLESRKGCFLKLMRMLITGAKLIEVAFCAGYLRANCLTTSSAAEAESGFARSALSRRNKYIKRVYVHIRARWVYLWREISARESVERAESRIADRGWAWAKTPCVLLILGSMSGCCCFLCSSVCT